LILVLNLALRLILRLTLALTLILALRLSRAANGVIIFTTRSGKSSQRTNISFDGYTGVQYFDHIPELANPSEVAEILRVARVNAGYTPEDPQFYHEQYYLTDEEGNFVRWGLPDYVVPAGYAIDIRGPLDESTYQFGTADFAYTRANKEGTNWTEKIYEPGIVQNYNLSATGGSDRGQFVLSAGYFDQDGVIKYTNYKRYSFRINTLFNIKDRIRIGENLGFSWHRSVGETRVMGGFAGGLPEIWPVYDIAGNFRDILLDILILPPMRKRHPEQLFACSYSPQT